ncbi:MAG: Eco57I restriction-modification methylase domain-containing protein [Candidatus Xenobiia bacterium LiM19]
MGAGRREAGTGQMSQSLTHCHDASGFLRFRETFLEGTAKCFSRCSDTFSTYYSDEQRGLEQSFWTVLISLFLHFTGNRTPDSACRTFCPLPGMSEINEQEAVCRLCTSLKNTAENISLNAGPPEEALAGIDYFFRNYTFSISERSPWDHSAVIDLSLLASVCERLTKAGSASEKGGVVYTPCAEIDLMCRLAIAEALTNTLGAVNRDLVHGLIFAYQHLDKKEIDITFAEMGLWKPLMQKLMSMTICDPSCGGASFLAAMLSLMDDLCRRGCRSLGEIYDPRTARRHFIGHSLYGVDINIWACRFATMRLWLSLFAQEYCQNEALSLTGRKRLLHFTTHIRCFDSLALPCLRERNLNQKPMEERLYCPGAASWNAHFPDIFAGETPGFDIVIGNPPYVRQEMLVSLPGGAFQKGDYKQQAARHIYQRFPDFFGEGGDSGEEAQAKREVQVQADSQAQAERQTHGKARKQRIGNRSIDRRSDLYIYFFFLGFALLKEGGTISFLSSRAWLEVSYGRILREFLFRQTILRMIIENEMHRSFPSAFVNTAIVVASISQQIDPGQKSRFILLKIPFEDAASSSLFKNTTVEKEKTDRYEILSVRQSELFHTATCTSEQSRQSIDFHFIQSEVGSAGDGLPCIQKKEDRYQNGFMPRVPEIYRILLEKGRDILIPLGAVASLKRGITTGANEFFYLDRSALQKWGVEEEYLKPLIRSPRECRRMLIYPEKHHQRVFICQKDREELKGTNALEYILHGEERLIHRRPSLRGKNRWWELKSIEEVTHLWQKSVDRRHLQCQLVSSAIIDQRLYQLHYKAAPYALTAVMNSAVTILFREVAGRVSLGEGALDSAVYEAMSLPVVDPLRLDEKNSEAVIKALSSRDIGTVDEEFRAADRAGLDEPVFDLLSLTAGERESVYEAVLSLVKSRIARARCFRKPD